MSTSFCSVFLCFPCVWSPIVDVDLLGVFRVFPRRMTMTSSMTLWGNVSGETAKSNDKLILDSGEHRDGLQVPPWDLGPCISIWEISYCWMVQRSQSQPPFGCTKPCKWCDFNYVSLNWWVYGILMKAKSGIYRHNRMLPSFTHITGLGSRDSRDPLTCSKYMSS